MQRIISINQIQFKNYGRFAGGCKTKERQSSTSTQTNRFSGGCTCNTTAKKQIPESTQYVTDVHWYPEKSTLVIEKNDHKNVVVDLSEIIPDELNEPTLKDDIKVLVWNPNTEQYNNLKIADKGDVYTNALQKIVANIGSYDGPVMTNNVRKIAQQVVDENLVWKEWDDTDPQS